MSNEEDEERRLYECVRKYDLILKQFNELVVMIDAKTRAPKRRKVSGSKANKVIPNQADHNEAIVQKVTKFLEELGSTNPSGSSCSANRDDED